MKMSRACSGMLSTENDDFKFLKTAINIKCTYHSSRANCFISPNELVVDQKHECNNSQRAVLHIFRNIEISILVTFH